MEKKLLTLYDQFLLDLNNWNETERDQFEEFKEPTFAMFMKWLAVKEYNENQEKVEKIGKDILKVQKLKND